MQPAALFLIAVAVLMVIAAVASKKTTKQDDSENESSIYPFSYSNSRQQRAALRRAVGLFPHIHVPSLAALHLFL